jgi:hypothetical protein
MFLFRRKGWARTFFIGRKYFSSGAKVGREHFLKAANVSLQAQRLGANIFHRLQIFLFRRKGWARTLFIGCKYFSSAAKVGREHFSKAANISLQAQRWDANIFKPAYFSKAKYAGSKAKS